MRGSGPDNILIYEDLYRPLLETKAATLGGRFLEVRAEISEQVEALLSESLKTQEANVIEKVPFRISINEEWVEKICTLTNNPVWCQTEQDAYVAGIWQSVIDHSKEVQAEAHLRESEARLRRIFQSISKAVIVTDQDTRIAQMNPVAEELTGWTAQEALGQRLDKACQIVHEQTHRTFRMREGLYSD